MNFYVIKIRRVRPHWSQTLIWLAIKICKKKKKYEKKLTLDTSHVTPDTWNLTPDTWHLICDTWHVTHGGDWIFSQNVRSPALWFGMNSVLKILNKRMTYSWTIYKCVYWTSLATPGRLKNRLIYTPHFVVYISFKCYFDYKVWYLFSSVAAFSTGLK